MPLPELPVNGCREWLTRLKIEKGVMVKHVLVIALFSLSLGMWAELHARSLDQTIVFIKCSYRGGGNPFYGTGVLVGGDGKVLTAKQVIPEGDAYCEGAIGKADTRETMPMIILQKHDSYDAALLRFTPEQEGQVFQYLRYCDADRKLKGKSISATGFIRKKLRSKKGELTTHFPSPLDGLIKTNAVTIGMVGGKVTIGDSLIGITVDPKYHPGTGGQEGYGILAAEKVADEFGLEREDKRLCSSGLKTDQLSGFRPPSRSQKTAPEKKPTGLVAFDQSIEDKLVYIECADQGKQGKRTRGSGVLVSSEGHVLTAKHVVPDGFQCYGVVGTAGQNPTQKLLRSPRGSHIEVDAALLKFIPKPGEVFPFVRYSKLMRNFKKKEIDVWGFPDGGTGEASTRPGTISTTTTDENGFFTTTALSGSGMSGGPVVLRENGCLIGIVGGAKFDLKTAVPISYKVLAVDLVGHAFRLVEAPKHQTKELASHEGDVDARKPDKATTHSKSGRTKESEKKSKLGECKVVNNNKNTFKVILNSPYDHTGKMFSNSGTKELSRMTSAEKQVLEKYLTDLAWELRTAKNTTVVMQRNILDFYPCVNRQPKSFLSYDPETTQELMHQNVILDAWFTVSHTDANWWQVLVPMHQVHHNGGEPALITGGKQVNSMYITSYLQGEERKEKIRSIVTNTEKELEFDAYIATALAVRSYRAENYVSALSNFCIASKYLENVMSSALYKKERKNNLRILQAYVNELKEKSIEKVKVSPSVWKIVKQALKNPDDPCYAEVKKVVEGKI